MIARINSLRTLSLTMLLLGSGMVASAQDNTEELLTAPRVRRFLAIGPTSADGETMICRDVLPDRLSLDPVGGCKRVAAKTPFAFISSTRDQIQVLRPEFNPLREMLVVMSSLAPETATVEIPGYEGLSKAAGSLLKSIEKTPSGGVVKAADSPCRTPFGMSGYVACLDHLRGKASPSLTRWAAKTNGLAGIREMRSELRDLSKELQDNITRTDELRDTLLNSQTGADKDEQNTQTIEGLRAIAANGESLTRAKGLVGELKGLDGALKAFDDPARWVGNSLLVHSIDTDLEEIQIRKIGISDTAWSYSEDDGLSQVSKERSPVTLRARAARRLVPEVSAALVHTRLARKVYSAVEENGRTVVKQGKDEGVDVKPAGLLNFVCRCFGDTSLYPMLQVGTTEVDSAPAFLVGGGLRLFGKTPLAISAGGIVAWMRDLNNLKPGDVVKSALEVDADLKRRMQIRLYVALQYKF